MGEYIAFSYSEFNRICIDLLLVLPRKEKEEGTQPEQNIVGKHLELKISDIRSVLLDKSLFLIGLVLLGAQITFGLSLPLHYGALKYNCKLRFARFD